MINYEMMNNGAVHKLSLVFSIGASDYVQFASCIGESSEYV